MFEYSHLPFDWPFSGSATVYIWGSGAYFPKLFENERKVKKKKTFQNTNHLLEEEKSENFRGDLLHLYRNRSEELNINIS